MKTSRLFMQWLVRYFAFIVSLTVVGLQGSAVGNMKWASQSVRTDSIQKLWSTTETELGPKEWLASWIWRRGETEGTNLVLLTRKRFTLVTKPDQARIFITADNNYELYVNGQFVNRGPARCAPHHQSFDVMEIASLLQAGENVLAVRVLHEGRFGTYNTTPRPGLLVQLEMRTNSKPEIIKSNSSWKVKKPEGTNLNTPIYGETVDFRREEKGWQEIQFDDSQWTDAEELLSDRYFPWPQPSRGSKPKTLTYPWLTLVPRDLPYLKESLVKGTHLFEAGEILEMGYNNPVAEGARGLLFPLEKGSLSGLETYQKSEGPLTIQNGYPSNLYSSDDFYSTYLIFDMGELMHGYPHLEIEANAGTIVEVIYAPHLLRGKFPLRTDISGRSLTDKIILTSGKTVWEALELKYMRYLFIAVRSTEKPVKLFFAGLKRSDYPFKPCGAFSVNKDNEVEWLWQASINTLRAITTDAFTDNYRERLQYAQTSYYSARSSFTAFGDSYLQRQYLKEIAQEQMGDGILPASAPVPQKPAGRWLSGGRFLDASIFWVMGLHDYFLHTGDTLTVRDLLPAAEKVMDRFRIWENKEGIIDSPPYPYWIDHANLDRSGANFSLNALYLLAMQDFITISKWIGNDKEAREYEKRAENLRENLRNKFWNINQKLFSDTRDGEVLSNKFTEQSNSLAIVAGIATREQQQEIVKEILENKSARLVPAVLFMNYIAEALFMTGHGEQALSLLKDRYRHMKIGDSETLWEEWGLTVTNRSGRLQPTDGRSIAQAENTFLVHSFTRWLLGVHPTKPGITEVILSCNLCGLHEVKGCFPCPQGSISIAWKETKRGKYLEVEVPAGTHTYIDLISLNMKNKIILLDGKTIATKTQEEDKLEIPTGKHTLEFY